jgi:hypothetical protein
MGVPRMPTGAWRAVLPEVRAEQPRLATDYYLLSAEIHALPRADLRPVADMSCSKPITQFDLNRIMAARAKALTKLFKELSAQLECVYTSWEDGMRADGSNLGPNVKDVGLVFRNGKGKEGSAETFGFKVRSNNFNELLVEIDARVFKIPVCDKDGKNPRMVTLAYALEHAGELFAHCGLPADCNLYHPELDNGKVKLRIDLIFAPKGERAPGEEFAAKEFSMTTVRLHTPAHTHSRTQPNLGLR